MAQTSAAAHAPMPSIRVTALTFSALDLHFRTLPMHAARKHLRRMNVT